MNAAANFTHTGLGSTRAPSWEIWRRMGEGPAAADALGGIHIYERFEKFQGLDDTASSAAAVTRPSSDSLTETTVPLPTGGIDGHSAFMTALSKITKRTDVTGNIVQFAPVASDNGLVIISPGAMAKISNDLTVSGLTLFEARIALPTQVASGSTFTGLGSIGAVASGGLVADSGAFKADQGCIGFRTKEDDADGIDFVYQKVSTAEVVVKNVLQAAVAGTFYKLGFVFDPEAPVGKRISVFLDGVMQDFFVTKDDIDASTFPTSIMGPVLAAMTQATTQRLLDVDWYRFYQRYPS